MEEREMVGSHGGGGGKEGNCRSDSWNWCEGAGRLSRVPSNRCLLEGKGQRVEWYGLCRGGDVGEVYTIWGRRNSRASIFVRDLSAYQGSFSCSTKILFILRVNCNMKSKPSFQDQKTNSKLKNKNKIIHYPPFKLKNQNIIRNFSSQKMFFKICT